MKIDYKNPMLYYIAVPVVAGLWAVLAGLVFYPDSIKTWESEKADYAAVEKRIKQLVELQPKRLAYKVDGKAKSEDFDFTNTIDDFAQLFSISPSNYSLNVRAETKRAGRKTRSAAITIKNIEIERASQFISAMLVRWTDLKCESLGLERVKNTKNRWKVDMKLTYYY